MEEEEVEDEDDNRASNQRLQIERLQKTYFPVLAVVIAGILTYPLITEIISTLLEETALGVIRGDASQFMQNFFNYNGLLFSFFSSTTYACLYSQQESIYFAIYAEIAEVRSLMEQLTLISQGRPNYRSVMRSLNQYVEELSLGVRMGCPPAVLLSAKPERDPLERILYLTSVGLPSPVYETVRSLRQARGTRLGATQLKLPYEHFVLLSALAFLELLAFPLLGAGIAGYEEAGQAMLPGHILSLQSVVFSCLLGAVFLTLRIIEDLRHPTQGFYSLNQTLEDVVLSLQTEVRRRMENPDAPDEEAAKAARWYEETSPLPVIGQYATRDVFSLQGEAWSSLVPQPEAAAPFKKLQFSSQIGIVAALCFPFIVLLLQGGLSDAALQAIREDNNAQWLQNFFTGVGFVFSLFVAQTFAFLYSQQEQIFLAIYTEVSEAKALLEQLSLVCRSRASFVDMLQCMRDYIRNDLRRLDASPADLLAKSSDDPLENILYLTSVGTPSNLYDTVRELRQARGQRLGATQRKLPPAHFALLAVLGVLELSVFPVLAAGCAELDKAAMMPGHILFFHAVLFGLMSSAVALTIQVLLDLWGRPTEGTYNVRGVLLEMVSGLEEELDVRLADAGGDPRHSEKASSQVAEEMAAPVLSPAAP